MSTGDFPETLSQGILVERLGAPRSANITVQRISFEKKSPQRDLKQETYRKHPVLE